MKILLIQPPSLASFIQGDDVFAPEPLALEYIGAGVSDRHDVHLLDMRFDHSFESTFADFNPDVVGLTAYTFHVNTVIKICQQMKTMKPSVVTVIGGHHATVSPEDFNIPAVDIIVLGEGVFTFRELVERLESGKDISDVKGIALKENGRLTFTPPREFMDLDSLPHPNRKLTSHIRYHLFHEEIQDIALMVTSKGCPYRCKFCCCWKSTGGKYMTRSCEAVIEELKSISEPVIHFADDESFIDVKRMEQLANLIREAGIEKNYVSYIRSDTVVRHPDLVKKWREIGLTCVLIGLESNRDKDLDVYDKKNTVQTNNQAITMLKEMGIAIIGSFIIHPDFEEKDFDDLAEYVGSIEIDIPFFNILTPFPGCELYDEVKDQLLTRNYDLFDFTHTVLPTKLSLRRFYAEVHHLYIRFAKYNLTRSNSIASSLLGKNYFLEKKFFDIMNKQKKAYLDHENYGKERV